MVAIFKTGHSIRAMLNYNENKVKEGKVEYIGQGNYLVDKRSHLKLKEKFEKKDFG